ncbi:hypothetical protein J7E73_21870 [Paenibacillus albidus]|uniref:PQQ-binding-like beta-propeller repeat protein n=1 Tax=Paenibacillus albidus TaxID=2041023 RepID=UPI001BE570AA|nr:PQQ-binding-like beta-propeller repeat protein [Paenibacillus albidus]MBT2291725.1 hypothetical protein [Paenibacillus albidus]
MKSSKYSKWASLVLTGVLSLTLSAHASAAAAQPGTTMKPSWTSPSLFTPTVLVKSGSEAVIHDVKAFPDKKLVYVYMGQNVPNTTGKTKQEWSVDTLKALDANTGKLKWEYVFHESKGPYTITSKAVFGSSGTSYVYQAFSDKTYKLYSVNSAGQLNWMQKLTGPSNISLMKDGSVLTSTTGVPNAKGVVKSVLTLYNSSGKQLLSQQVQGSVITAQGERIVMAASPMSRASNGTWLEKSNPRLEVYDLSLKQLYAYQTPAGSNIYGEGSPGQFVLNDGTFIIRIHLADNQNKLLAFGPEGKPLWGRSIPGSAYTEATASGYIVYENGKFTLYDLAGQVGDPHTFLDAAGETFGISRTSDGNLSFSMKEDQMYILNPKTLQTIHGFSITDLNLGTNDYAAHTVYSSSEDGKLFKFVLPVK